ANRTRPCSWRAGRCRRPATSWPSSWRKPVSVGSRPPPWAAASSRAWPGCNRAPCTPPEGHTNEGSRVSGVLRAVWLSGRGAGSRRSDAPWRHVDFLLLSVTSALAMLGLLMISSATYRRLQLDGVDPHLYLKKQLLYVAVGAVVMVVAAVVDYRVFCDY